MVSEKSTRICFFVDLGDGATVRIQTNGEPPSADDIEALRQVRDCLVARLADMAQKPKANRRRMRRKDAP